LVTPEAGVSERAEAIARAEWEQADALFHAMVDRIEREERFHKRTAGARDFLAALLRTGAITEAMRGPLSDWLREGGVVPLYIDGERMFLLEEER